MPWSGIESALKRAVEIIMISFALTLCFILVNLTIRGWWLPLEGEAADRVAAILQAIIAMITYWVGLQHGKQMEKKQSENPPEPD